MRSVQYLNKPKISFIFYFLGIFSNESDFKPEDEIKYNDESFESEIYAMLQFGLKLNKKTIVLNEKQMSRWQCTKPEMIIRDGNDNVSIEVKRIFSAKRLVERPSHKFNRKRVPDVWHWHSTIKHSLEKINHKFLNTLYENTKIRLDKHIVLIILPLSMDKNDVNRIVQRSIWVYENDFEPIINTKMYFVFGPDNLFGDLR